MSDFFDRLWELIWVSRKEHDKELEPKPKTMKELIMAAKDGEKLRGYIGEWTTLKVPVLTMPDHAYGESGYLDGLRPEDMSASVMKGQDRQGRAFVAIRARVFSASNPKKMLCKGVEVYFQREVSAQIPTWVSGGDFGLVQNRMTDTDHAVLTALIRHGYAYIQPHQQRFKNGMSKIQRRVIRLY